MITKEDVLLLLSDLEDDGEDISKYEDSLYAAPTIPFETLKFINSKRTLDLVNFYEKIRKSYNHKSSKLYKNIVKCDEQNNMDAHTILTTLTAFLNQALQFKPNDEEMFYEHARVDEVADVLKHYFSTFDLGPAYKLLKLIKADLVVSEYINGRRQQEKNK